LTFFEGAGIIGSTHLKKKISPIQFLVEQADEDGVELECPWAKKRNSG